MTVRRQSPFSIGIAMLFALSAFAGSANAQGSCTTGSGTVTCTGGAGSAVNDTNNLNTYPPNTIAAQTGFGTTIDVTGGGSAVSTVSVTLNGYTSVLNDTSENYYASVEMGLMLVSPSGQNMELLRCPG